MQNKVDWAKFLARHDLVFNHPPEKWGEGAFTGNGLIGAMVYLTDDKSALRFRIGRSDMMVKQNYRVPIGDLVLHPVGKITGGKFRLDLWNAEVTGTLTTDKGEIAFRTFTHASDLVQIIDLKPTDGERDCKWEFQPGLCVNPRMFTTRNPFPRMKKVPIRLSMRPVRYRRFSRATNMRPSGKRRTTATRAHSSCRLGMCRQGQDRKAASRQNSR